MSEETQEDPTAPPAMFNKVIKWLFIAAFLFILFVPLGLLKHLQREMSKQPSSRDVGHLIHVAPAGGLGGHAVVETKTGFYPLAAYITAAKGTSLVLVSRACDERFICDSPRTLCVPTASRGFELPKVQAKSGVKP